LARRAQLQAVLDDELANIGRRTYPFLEALLRTPSSQYVMRDDASFRVERSAKTATREGRDGLLVRVTVTRVGGIASMLPMSAEVFVAKPT